MGLSMGPWVGRVDVASGRSCQWFFVFRIKLHQNFRQEELPVLLLIDAFSRGKESIESKGIYSPRHVAPAEDPILTASGFLVWVV